MNNATRHVSLWSSKHSDRNDLAKQIFNNDIDAADQHKIRAAFTTNCGDERVNTYTSDLDSPIFARTFG
jgi:hypothetical protein